MKFRSYTTKVSIPDDCRALVLYVQDAMQTDDWLGFGSRDAYLRDGLGIEPEVVGWALDGLRHYGLDVPVPLREAVELGKRGRPKKGEEKGGVATFSPGESNTVPYLCARLQRDHPDLAAQVEAGALSAHAAAIEAGFRRKPTPLDDLRRVWAKASPAERVVPPGRP